MGDPANIDIGWRSALMLAVCMPLLMASIMLLTRQVERAANLWLGLFLVIAIVAQVPQIIGFANFYDVWPGLTFAPFNVELYAGPLIYLHAYSLMHGGKLGWRKWLIVPGLLQTTYYIWAFLTLGDYQKKWAYNGAFHGPYVQPIETILGILFLIIAIALTLRMIARYETFLNATQSAVIDFRPTWLRYLMIAMIGAGLIFAGLEIVPMMIETVSYVTEYPAQIALTMIIAWLGFEAVARTNSPFPKMGLSVDCLPPEDLQTEAQNWVENGETLRSEVISKGWFLEPRFSIRDLAQRMGSNETYISRALNQGLGQSFNRFINAMRVENAKGLIIAGETSLLDVAYEAGFNSKATFNRVFRDLTGMTPSTFKKSQKP